MKKKKLKKLNRGGASLKRERKKNKTTAIVTTISTKWYENLCLRVPPNSGRFLSIEHTAFIYLRLFFYPPDYESM